MFSLAARALRHLPAVVAFALACSLPVGAFLLVRPRDYTSASAFIPQTRRSNQGGLGRRWRRSSACSSRGQMPHKGRPSMWIL